MNEKEIRDQIKNLTVEIETTKERGTGVLITYKNKPYILTVHHVIYGKAKRVEEIEPDEVEFIFHNQARLYAKGIKTIGNLVLLELNSKELPRFDRVLFDEVLYNPNYYIRGFPTGLNKAHNFRAKCNDDAIDRERFKIELLDMTNDTSGEDAIEYMKGVSGSGVFFSKNKKLYLVGLVNALANQSGTFNAVECFNLRKLIKKKKAQKKNIFKKVIWLVGTLALGGLALFYYLQGLESEALAQKDEIPKERARLKPSIPTVTDKIPPAKEEKKVIENIEIIKTMKSKVVTSQKVETIKAKEIKVVNVTTTPPLPTTKAGKPILLPKNVTIQSNKVLYPKDSTIIKPKKGMVLPQQATLSPIENTKKPYVNLIEKN